MTKNFLASTSIEFQYKDIKENLFSGQKNCFIWKNRLICILKYSIQDNFFLWINSLQTKEILHNVFLKSPFIWQNYLIPYIFLPLSYVMVMWRLWSGDSHRSGNYT